MDGGDYRDQRHAGRYSIRESAVIGRLFWSIAF